MSVQLRFVSGGAWDSKAIEWETWSEWSHVELMTSSSITLGAMLDGGVAYRMVDGNAYKHLRKSQIVQIPLTPEQESVFWKFAKAQVGKPYDWRAIIGFGFRRNWRDPDSYFCSEYVARCLEVSGWLFLPAMLPVYRISPGLLATLVASHLRLNMKLIPRLEVVA